MNRLLSHRIHVVMVMLISMLTFTSCYESYPPGYDGTGYDRDLTGLWELSHINGYRVSDYEVNWLDFYGDGWGMYYFQDGPHTYEMSFEYYSTYDYDNWLNIHYSDGSYAEMLYWFSYNYSELYLEWYEHGDRITYTYQYCDPYWAPSALKLSETRSDDINFGFRPGMKMPDKQ